MAPSLVISGRPSRTRQMSALVPPTSMEMMSRRPAEAGHAHRPDHAGGGAREHGLHRLADARRRAGDTAVGLHDEQGSADALGVERRAQHAHVAAHRRHDGGVQGGGHAALELAELREHLRRERHQHSRILVGEDGVHALLVRGVGVGVQEDHGHRGDAELGELARHRPRAILVEGREDGAVRVQALRHLEDAVGRDGAGRACSSRRDCRGAGCRGGRSPART